MKNVTVCILLIILNVGCMGNKNPWKNTNNDPIQFILVNGVEATHESFNEVASVFGKTTDHEIAVGVGFIISYFRMSPTEAASKLKKYLSLSEEFDLPVIVQLDGEQWWGNRPDLWNWWDEDKPGYNLENKKNVEWTAWTPDSAVKIGWRNWGRQLRVLPMPNLMSPDYRQACHREMGNLVPIVMNWWKSLPDEKKYLLVGIKVGWESAIGVNNWYYPNGNALLDEPESEDPDYGLETDSLPDRGVRAIGYAAVSTQGLASSGKLRESDVTEVVRIHLEDLCRLAADLGVSRDRLFTHGGGWSQGETLYSAAVNKFSCPGWSFYDYAVNPENDRTAMQALEQSDAPYWGAVEWLYMGEHTQDQWTSAIKNSLSVNKLKYMCIYNWRDIKNNSNAISAIKEITKK
jgi:hypothetical protein